MLNKILQNALKTVDADDAEKEKSNIINFINEYQEDSEFLKTYPIDYDLHLDLIFLQNYELSKSIIEFERNQNIESFQMFLNSIFLDLINICLTVNEIEIEGDASQSLIDSDLNLHYICLNIFFNDYKDVFIYYLSLGLKHIHEENFSEFINCHYAGRDSLSFLAYNISKSGNKYNFSENISKLIDDVICDEYQNIFDNSGISNIDDAKLFKVESYRNKNTKLNEYSVPFYKTQWIFFPVELIYLIKQKKEYDINDFQDKYYSKFINYINCKFLIDEKNTFFYKLIENAKSYS